MPYIRRIIIRHFLFILLLLAVKSYAQVDISIGNGTTANTDWVYPCPLADSYDATRMQFLYLASELRAKGMTAGNINAIRFKVTDLGMYAGANSAADNLIIKIGTTATASLGATSWEPGTVIVYGPVNHMPVMGNNSFPFTLPFFWNGTDNIVIEICTDAGAADSRMANPYVSWTTGLAFNGSHTIGDNFNGNLCDAATGSSQGDPTTRPDIIFNWTAAGPCNGAMLTAGTAASTVAQTCGAASFMLTLNGASVATGLSYQWQSSTNNSTWNNIPGATAAGYKASQTLSTWYRAIVTCAAGGTATSAPVQVVTPQPVSGIFTINKNQPAGGGNFQSFNAAYNFIKCGINGAVTFNVAAGSGTYTEQLTLFNVPGSSAANTITFNGAPGTGISFVPTQSKSRAVIKLDGADHFIFNNLTVTAAGAGPSQYGYGYQLTNDADSNVIYHNTIHTSPELAGDNYAGIVVSGSATSATNEAAAYCDANVFKANTITGGRYGITLVGNTSIANGNNTISDNFITDFAETGIYISCSFNTLVDSNHLSRPLAADAAEAINGVFVSSLNARLTISRNTITNIFGGAYSAATFYGIRFDGAAGLGGGLENKVQNNLVYNINGGGDVYGLYNVLSHNALYYHNTISLDGAGNSTANTNVARGFYQDEATGIVLYNNPAGGDYPSFTAAVAALQCGIGGPVFFDIAPGTYTEQVSMRRIPGASASSRVTFRAANGNAASVTLAANGTAAANYVLKLDSASYITYRNITITATSPTYGRAIELAGTSAYDSLLNNIINTGATTSVANTRAAIYAAPLKGTHIVIMGNTIRNGASGIYIAGTGINRNNALSIISNTLSGFYQYGIYAAYSDRARIAGNAITMTAPLNNTAYGIYTADADSSFQLSANVVNISNAVTTVYGIAIQGSIAYVVDPGRVENNKVIAVSGNTGNLYGLQVASANNVRIINNVISIKTSGNNSYGLYSNSNINGYVYNNTVYSTATSSDNNIAAYFTDGYDEEHYADIRNNIFAHEGGGKALYASNITRIYSDYNLLYTTGATLVEHGFGDEYATLSDWKANGDLDVNSIVFKPAFISAANPAPDLNNPGVWAMHGRGIQLDGNNQDINQQPRPVTLKAGVPDLGAYEFVPAVQPPVSTPVPAIPAANTRQDFMLGTDTVYTIHWGAAVPQQIAVRRYSGVMPPALTPGTDYMYFYVDADITASNPLSYAVTQHYLDPWRGFIDSEPRIRLGRTDAAGTWIVDTASRVNTTANLITRQGLNYIDRFTGLTNGQVSNPGNNTPAKDTSNRGTRFWVGYGHNNYVQTFVIKMGGADHDANVTIKVNGTSWMRNYHVPANTFVNSDPIPRTGASGAVLLTEGLSDRGISIESDKPIAAYVQADGILPVTGSTMLIPSGAYGYEYYALAWEQRNYDVNVYSWFYVIADHDSTMVEITPVNPTFGGRRAGEPFVVTLQKGEVYQVLGAGKSENEGYDLSGSKIRSVSNASGKCYPVAVFSGNSRAFIDCAESFVPFGNYLIQQNIPAQHWGTQYLTAPTARADTPWLPQTNFYRVLVKDPATIVKVNGAQLTGRANNFYSYQSATADLIEADKPVMVAQYIPGSSNVCEFGQSGPEMFYLPSAAQGIRKASFYRTAEGIRNDNYLTLILPTAGLSSLRIDGSNKFDSTYSHPNKTGYTVVVKRWEPDNTTSTVQSDSSFTALAYGLSGTNTYGYTVGRSFSQLIARPGITNVYDSSGNYSRFTCAGTPFRYSILLPVQANSITWQFSRALNMVPDADSIQLNPVPVDTVLIDGRNYYRYTLQGEYTFPSTGVYTVPVLYTHPVIAGCAGTEETALTITVVGAPSADFDVAYSGCLNDIARFTSTASATNGDVVNRFRWDFGDNTTSIEKDPAKEYSAPGNYTVKLMAITQVGCIADTAKPLEVKDVASFSFVKDTVTACPGAGLTLAVNNPQTGVVYNWYDAFTGGTLKHSGASLSIARLTAITTYYVSADLNGCISKPRQAITAYLAPVVAAPVVRIDSLTSNMVRFAWNAVPGADAYQVSADRGNTWITPSSGSTGLTHTILGLPGGTEVSLMVKAIDPNLCKDGVSDVKTIHIPHGDVFIPNAFTPNGDGLNDMFKAEGYVRSVHLQVFNQWGEKVFESNEQSRGWDGNYKGAAQPSGVYIYVCAVQLDNGGKIIRKGSIHLIR